ncbi:MAG: hypothetical protein RLZZ612_2555, partial [Pseudomonadota bacterium]
GAGRAWNFGAKEALRPANDYALLEAIVWDVAGA